MKCDGSNHVVIPHSKEAHQIPHNRNEQKKQES